LGTAERTDARLMTEPVFTRNALADVAPTSGQPTRNRLAEEIPSAEPYFDKVWREAGDKKRYGQEPFEGVDRAAANFKGNSNADASDWVNVPLGFMTGVGIGAFPPMGIGFQDSPALTGESGGGANAMGAIRSNAPNAYRIGEMIGTAGTTAALTAAKKTPWGLGWAAWRALNNPDLQQYARDWYYHGDRPQTKLDPSDIEYARPRYPTIYDVDK
jgi:hypothetical protein